MTLALFLLGLLLFGVGVALMSGEPVKRRDSMTFIVMFLTIWFLFVAGVAVMFEIMERLDENGWRRRDGTYWICPDPPRTSSPLGRSR